MLLYERIYNDDSRAICAGHHANYIYWNSQYILEQLGKKDYKRNENNVKTSDFDS